MENPERDWDAVNDDERDNPPGREPEDSLTDAQAQAMRVAELGTVIPDTWDVHEGRPSWHQQRAGHISAAATVGFTSEAEAEEFARGLREHHPDMPVFVLKHRS